MQRARYMRIFFRLVLVLLLNGSAGCLLAQVADRSEAVEATNPPAPKEDQKVKKQPEVISLTGSLDAYFHKSIATNEKAPHTSFSNLPGFSLGMVNLIGSYTGKNTGFVIDLVVGPRGADAVFNAPMHVNSSGGGSAHLINQMYAWCKLTRNVKLNLGQFNTFLGYESISPLKNFHYGTSYLFSYGPFNHTGLWADIDFRNGWTGKLAFMNPTDYTEFNPFDSFTLGGQLAYLGNGKNISLNTTYGDPDGKLDATDSVGTLSSGNAFQLDFTATINVVPKYQVGFNSSYRTTRPGEVMTTMQSKEKSSQPSFGFYGIAMYQKVLFTDHFNMGLRTEYFNEFHGGVGAIGGYDGHGYSSVFEVTLSANFIAEYLRFIPEVRVDKTSLATFTSEATNAPLTAMCSFNFAVIYALPAITHEVNHQK